MECDNDVRVEREKRVTHRWESEVKSEGRELCEKVKGREERE